jgi:RimJ/RimL family protein N-acetyltransferase
MGVTLREFDLSSPDDTVRLWQWANDAETRAYSFGVEPIGWWRHLRWLMSAEQDIRIAEIDGVSVGTARINQNNEVSITIAPEHRGKGYAAQIISGLPTSGGLIAKIKPDNERSLRAFTKAGFVVDHIVMRHE